MSDNTFWSVTFIFCDADTPFRLASILSAVYDSIEATWFEAALAVPASTVQRYASCEAVAKPARAAHPSRLLVLIVSSLILELEISLLLSTAGSRR